MKVKSNYKYLERIDTRFGDNDIFGHINNVIYYSLFDSVINRFLITNCQYDPFNSDVIAISPETRCKFRKSLKYPDKVEAGLSTFKIALELSSLLRSLWFLTFINSLMLMQLP